MLGKHLVALHHLIDRPLQRARGLFRVGDDRNEQMRDAVVGRKLDHLRVDHDKAHLFGRRLIEHRDDERVRADRLTGARRTGNEHVRQLRDVADDVPAADVLTNGKGRGGGVLRKLARFKYRADIDGRNELVRHLDADDGDLVGNGGDAHAACAERKGNIVLQVGDLRELHALAEREFVARDRRAAHHIARLSVHAEARERLRQAAGVVAQLRACFGSVRYAALFQQRDGRILIGGRLGLIAGLDLARDFFARGVDLGAAEPILLLVCENGARRRCGNRRALRRRCRHGKRRRRNGCGRRSRRADGSSLRQVKGRQVKIIGRHRYGLGRCRRGRLFLRSISICKQLVRALDIVRLLAEEAARWILPDNAFLTVERNVDRRIGYPCIAARRAGGTLRRQLFLLRLIGHALMRAHRLDHGGGRQAECHHQKCDKHHDEQDHCQHLFHQQHQHDRKRRGHRAAGFQCVAARPQEFQDTVHRGIFLFADRDVHDRAEHDRQQRRTDKARGHIAPTVEKQDIAPQKQCGSNKVIAPAKERSAQLRGLIKQPRARLKVAEAKAQRQHQQDRARDLAADGAFLAFLCRALAAGGRARGAR